MSSALEFSPKLSVASPSPIGFVGCDRELAIHGRRDEEEEEQEKETIQGHEIREEIKFTNEIKMTI